MAKNMARIKDGTEVNVEWRSDNTAESEFLKEIGDLPVVIGDTWKDGKFYRGVEEIIPLIAETIRENEEYSQALMLLGVEV